MNEMHGEVNDSIAVQIRDATPGRICHPRDGYRNKRELCIHIRSSPVTAGTHLEELRPPGNYG